MKIIDQAIMLSQLCDEHGVYSVNDLTKDQLKEFDYHYKTYFNLNGDIKMKITEKDIGRTFISHSGEKFKVIKMTDSPIYKILAKDEKTGIESYFTQECPKNFLKWEHDLHITKDDIDKIFIAKNGSEIKIINILDENSIYKIEAKELQENFRLNYTENGSFFTHCESGFDLVKIKEEVTQTKPVDDLTASINKFLADVSILKDKDFLKKISGLNLLSALQQTFYADLCNIFTKLNEQLN